MQRQRMNVNLDAPMCAEKLHYTQCLLNYLNIIFVYNTDLLDSFNQRSLHMEKKKSNPRPLELRVICFALEAVTSASFAGFELTTFWLSAQNIKH